MSPDPKAPPDFEDITAAAKAFLAIAPDRCLWGSDWPHIYLEGRPMPNTTDLFENARSWMDEATQRGVFVDNPARLYGF
jgi:predicted TIM-barrel fold metal-dependent hydrolase